MLNRPLLLSVLATTSLLLASCSSGSDASDTDPGPSSADEPTSETSETSEESGAETGAEPVDAPPATAPADNAENASDELAAPCSALMTADELESFVGRPIELSGIDTQCNMVFADDSIGNMTALSASRGGDLFDDALEEFLGNERSMANGVLLDDGRGFILDGSVAVRGDSGQVFRVTFPANADIADIDATTKAVADHLLTR